MDEFKAADIISLTNVIVAVVAVVVALLAPRISWKLNQRSQEEAAKRNTKLWIFAQLMEHRYSSRSRETVRALNLIDIAFHDDKKVRNLWQEYHGMISNRAFFTTDVGFEMIKQKKAQLLTQMAANLNYSIDQFDVERIYTPNWLADDEELAVREGGMRLSILRSRGPGNSPNSSLESSEQKIPDSTGRDFPATQNTAFVNGNEIPAKDP